MKQKIKKAFDQFYFALIIAASITIFGEIIVSLLYLFGKIPGGLPWTEFVTAFLVAVIIISSYDPITDLLWPPKNMQKKPMKTTSYAGGFYLAGIAC
ncbi:MAG: hypothetical protein HY764_02270 [Candidatus Portnoybacteria bacterium]|nr:hypothetical protein [Candidatus Portnoybacteria bacterium]